MFVVSKLANKNKKSVSLPFCHVTSPIPAPLSLLILVPLGRCRLPARPATSLTCLSLPVVPSPYTPDAALPQLCRLPFGRTRSSASTSQISHCRMRSSLAHLSPSQSGSQKSRRLSRPAGAPGSYTPFCFLPPWAWFPMAFASVLMILFPFRMVEITGTYDFLSV
jgi:hypothetical protein